MDIQYLLFLQGFRNSINDALTPFMEWASMFAVTYLILFAAFYYWYVNKRDGLYTLVSYYLCMFITPVTKLTACVYRPWIRDARIIPAGDAISTATGYSFPSGHTSTCAPLSGGLAVSTWKKKGTRWFSAIMVLYILITAFSRNYLGVHTPQDVLVALTESVLCLIAAAKLFAYLDRNPEKENMFLLGGLIICILALFYITLKSYPMEYTAEGKLIVDPQKMMNDGYGDIGKTIGFIIARFVEKTWIRFEQLKKCAKNLILCVVGLVIVVLLKQFLNPVMISCFGSHWGKLFFNLIYTFFIVALFPIVLKWIGEKERA